MLTKNSPMWINAMKERGIEQPKRRVRLRHVAMAIIGVSAVLAVTLKVHAAPGESTVWFPRQHSDARAQVGVVCFKTGERITGMNKICYYDCLGSEAAITVSSVSLCPISIKR